MAADSWRGVWTATTRLPSVGQTTDSSRCARSDEDARFLAQLEEMDPGRLMLELRTSREEASELRAMLQTAENDARLAKERADELRAQSSMALDNASLQMAELKAQVSELEAQVARLEEQLRSANEEADEVQGRHQEELALLMASTQDKDEKRWAKEVELEKELKSLRDQLESLEEDGKGHHQADGEEASKKVQSLTQELSLAQSQVEELQRQLEEDEDELDVLEAELSKSRKRVEELTSESVSLNSQLQLLQEELANEKQASRVAGQVAEDEANRRKDAERELEQAQMEVKLLQAELSEALSKGKETRGQEEEEEAEELALVREELAEALELARDQEEEFKAMLDAAKQDFCAREAESQQMLMERENELEQARRNLKELEVKLAKVQAMAKGGGGVGEGAGKSAQSGATNAGTLELFSGAKGDVARDTGTGGEAAANEQQGKEEALEEEPSGSEFSFSLPVPIKGAWRTARELAADYYDAGAENEEDELAAREAELEELQEENDRLAGEVENLQEQVLKSKRLVSNYEKMRRRIMQLRVCLELTRKVVEVKDRAMEMAIERARTAEQKARGLLAVQAQLEQQLGETEEELRRVLGDQQGDKGQGGKGKGKREKGRGSVDTPNGVHRVRRTDDEKAMDGRASRTPDRKPKTGLTVGIPGNWEEDEEEDMVAVMRGQEIQGVQVPGSAKDKKRRQSKHGTPAHITRTSSGTSKGSETPALVGVGAPVSMKDLQLARDSLKRVMRDLKEKAAILAETQLIIGRKGSSTKAQSDILDPVEKEISDAQDLLDKVERTLAKMAGLEIRGGNLRKKIEVKKQQLLEIESRLGFVNKRKVPASCFN